MASGGDRHDFHFPIGAKFDRDAGVPFNFIFDPPVDGTFELTNMTGGVVKLVREGVNAGTYQATAVDADGLIIAATLRASGSRLVQTVSPTSTAKYPIVVLPTFTASDATLPEVQEIYPDADTLSDDPAELTDDEPVEIIDEGTETFVADLKILAGEDAEADEPSALGPQSFAMSAASRPYIYVPKTTRNGRAVKQKYYYYDPNASHPKRKPWKKTWHDYCSSKSPDSYGRASFKGPCGRHDLCIEFKQATDRGYCDSFLKKNMRTNCRYAYSSVFDALALRICYGHAAGYYAAVAHSTKGNHDPGRWGNSNPSYYPQYRWDTW